MLWISKFHITHHYLKKKILIKKNIFLKKINLKPKSNLTITLD